MGESMLNHLRMYINI